MTRWMPFSGLTTFPPHAINRLPHRPVSFVTDTPSPIAPFQSVHELLQLDHRLCWHPYAAMPNRHATYPIVGTRGVRLELADGPSLIDGMASWWCAIHGYNHPRLNRAISRQLASMSHVMFGGLTHPRAVELARLLVELTPEPLESVFFTDSGSVAVEVAVKMAIQYWQGVGETGRTRLLTVRRGYHGDTTGAMALCDPQTGMHHLFAGLLPSHLFAPEPRCREDNDFDGSELDTLRGLLERHRDEIAAIIIEPIVQGAGGMRFYCPEYLRQLRALCDEQRVLLIFDEIATGFGRTGRLFALEHADVVPDILCLGKALTGGYMTLAATLTRSDIAAAISASAAGALMHGPTFMANPLACAVAVESIQLLLEGDWQRRVNAIESQLERELAPCRGLPQVADVRVKGAIGVVELHEPVDMATVQPQFVERGVWLRPFGRLIYTMPPFIIESDELSKITRAMIEVVEGLRS